MPLFYFNFRDDDGALSDETGAEYMSIEEAKTAALKCLAEVARDQGAAPTTRTRAFNNSRHRRQTGRSDAAVRARAHRAG
jgi:hypothetical protein